jgi:hypothetical protein
MAMQARQQSEQGHACCKSKMPSMFPYHGQVTSPDRADHPGTLTKAAAVGVRRREMVFSFLRRRREKFCGQGAMALAAFSKKNHGTAILSAFSPAACCLVCQQDRVPRMKPGLNGKSVSAALPPQL